MRKLVIGLALLAITPFLWQPAWGQSPTVRVNKATHKPKQQAKITTDNAAIDQRGTQNAPLLVDGIGRSKSTKEAAEEKADKDHAALINGWTLFFTGVVAGLTGMLVWVGHRAVCAALRTLRAIEKQVDVMVTSDRPWILADDPPKDFKLDMPPPGVSSDLVTVTDFRNLGKSICRVQEFSSRLHTVTRLEELPSEPFYHMTTTNEIIVPPNGKPFTFGTSLEGRVLSQEAVSEIQSGERFLCYYVRVRYRDIYNIDHVSQTCWIYHWPTGLVHHGLDDPQFRIAGPKAYNDYS